MDIIPYPGLRSFHHKESVLFFGREQHTELLLQKLSHSRFVSIVGPSGCGKSSLAQAGLTAALKERDRSDSETNWWVGMMRPGRHPMPNLAEALQRKSLLEEDHAKALEEEVIINQRVLTCFRRSSLGLVEVLRKNPLPKNTNLLLLVDQFEDVFRFYKQTTHAEMKAFVALLLASVQQDEFPIHVAIVIRSDYIGDCMVFRGLPEMMNESQFIVPLLTHEQQKKAIIEPAGMFGGEVEPHLVERLLEEMEGEPDQLPLLQHCLMRLWLRAKTRADNTDKNQNSPRTASVHGKKILMTLDDYATVGGFKNALSNHADETFWKLDGHQQQIAEHMFRRLGDWHTDNRYLSTSTRMSEIASIAEVLVSDVIKIVEIFRHPERHFLSPIAQVPLSSDSFISISHESLIRQWPQLKKWIEQETRSAAIYRHLEHTAHLWQQGKAALWLSPDLEHTLEWEKQEKPTEGWAKRYGRDFELAMKFLRASERKKILKRRLIGVLIPVGLLITVGFATWGVWDRIEITRVGQSIRIIKPSKETFHIRQVILEDAQGLIIAPLHQRYLVKPREKLIIQVGIDNPSDQKFQIEYYQFLEDRTQAEAVYFAPNMPGNHDIIVVRTIEPVTGEILDQYVAHIKIVDIIQ